MSRRPTRTRKPAKTQDSRTKRRRTSKPSSVARSTVAQPTFLPTGNGFGYAVVDAKSGALTGYLAHPYHFMRPPADVKDDGPETTDFIETAVWRPRSSGRSVSYLEQSHIIQVIGRESTAHFFMPFTLERNVLLAASDAVDPCLAVTWKTKVHSDQEVDVGGVRVKIVEFKDASERIVVVPLSNGGKSPRDDEFCGPAFAFISVENEGQIQAAVSDFQNWRRGQSVKRLIHRELQALEDWRVTPAVKFSSHEARDLWRQSETVLRMGQIRERDHRAYGLINASLPAGEFYIPFVRDMSYAVVALTKMGHREEAKAGLNAYYNAGPIGNLQAQVRGVPYQISLTRYFGDGSEENDYSGQTRPNLEFDNWGLALWATGEYFAEYGDRAWLNTRAAHGSVYETARDYVIKPLVKNLRHIGRNGGLIFRVDTSCWEQNDMRRQHYAFSNITAIGGLKALLPIAEAMGDSRTAAEIQKIIRQMRTGFQSAFVHGNEVRGTKEPGPRNAMDGALLEAINFGAITDPKQIESTVSRMSLLETSSGGYRRVRGRSGYELQEFLLMNFNLARAHIRLGNPRKGDALVERMQHKAARHNNLIPEMYVSKPSRTFPGRIGAPTGSIPMVGYGAGAYILYLMERRREAVDSVIVEKRARKRSGKRRSA
jgi:hypothetical protein